MILSLLKAGARLVLKVQRCWEIQGSENIPVTGGVLLAANHVSYWDPVAIVCAIERQVYFMAKAPSIKARWEMDLSPGATIVPRRALPCLTNNSNDNSPPKIFVLY
jgi:hypothetical protein